ncbi:MAG: MFS transporter [Promethearchaeia archaeon]
MTEMKKSFTPSYSSKDKTIWGIAAFGTSLISGVYGATLQYFFQVYMGLGAAWIGLAAWLFAIWNALNDPLFGFLSDKTRSEKGRRIPYMRFTAPFLGLFFILIWFVPQGLPDIGIFWWMLITMLLYDTAYTIIGLVYSALLPELTEDDHVRGQFQTSASLFQLIATILGFLLPDLLRPKAGQESLTPLYIGMIAIGIAGAICVLVTGFHFTERPEFTQVDEPLGIVDSLKYTFKSKSFITLTSANFMSIFVQAILLGAMFYLADYVMQVPTIMLLIFLFLGLVVGVLFANIFAGKIGVVKANQILLGLGGIALISLPFIPEMLIYGCLFFAGIGLSGPLVLTNVLFAQVADEDEIESGVRREASFFGVNAMITKPAQSLALWLSPLLLELSGFLTPPKGSTDIILDQPASALFTIKMVIGLIPGIVMLIGVLILVFYPLKDEYLEEVQEKVSEMHEEKHEKLKEQRQQEDQNI